MVLRTASPGPAADVKEDRMFLRLSTIMTACMTLFAATPAFADCGNRDFARRPGNAVVIGLTADQHLISCSASVSPGDRATWARHRPLGRGYVHHRHRLPGTGWTSVRRRQSGRHLRHRCGDGERDGRLAADRRARRRPRLASISTRRPTACASSATRARTCVTTSIPAGRRSSTRSSATRPARPRRG